MLMPKRVKHRKQHRGHRRGKASGGTMVSFGDYGLQAMESCWMTANQIEAARIAMNRYIKRQGKIWIRIFPDKPFTKKPAETRMGSGKGAPDGWVAVIKPGRVLFEMGGGITEAVAREAMRLASHKLPIETKFIKRIAAPDSKIEPTAQEEDSERTLAFEADEAAAENAKEIEDLREEVGEKAFNEAFVAAPTETPAAESSETAETNETASEAAAIIEGGASGTETEAQNG